MRKKTFQKILILSFILFGEIFLAPPVFGQDNLIVQFQATPLFNEINFSPGDVVTRWVKVTNNSGTNQKIAVEAINENDPDHLGDKLNIEIKEGSITLYNDTLSHFFSAGEIFLSNLASGNQTQYDFIVSFDPSAGNDFQGKTLGFDLLVGFQGQEGEFWGGALPQPRGLTITNEAVVDVQETSVTITWSTSYFSTSQVIYSRYDEPHNLNFNLPNYGYAHATPEDQDKVTFHTVTITGLTPGTTYYYRTVSHGSLAISQEHSFTTKGVAPSARELVPPQPAGGKIPSGPKITEKTIEEPAEKALPQGEISTFPPKEMITREGLSSSLLASLKVIAGTPWMVILVISSLLVLVIIGIREWELLRKKKKA